jgi:hypothetical protein
MQPVLGMGSGNRARIIVEAQGKFQVDAEGVHGSYQSCCFDAIFGILT